jgi:hypothetical protein
MLSRAVMLRTAVLGIFRRESSIRSPLGFSVPVGIRILSGAQAEALSADSLRRGFSRIGRRLFEFEAEGVYALVPYAMETSPEAAWMCSMFQIATRGELLYRISGIGTIDVVAADFEKLGSAEPATVDRVIQALAWKALQGQSARADDATGKADGA